MTTLRKLFTLAIVLFTLMMAAHASSEVVEAWVARYDGPSHGGDVARAIALGPDGSVHVTGRCWSGNVAAHHVATNADNVAVRYDPHHVATSHAQTSADYVTIKYDSHGHEQWVATYSGLDASCTLDDAEAIAVDADGNVYVTGSSEKSEDDRYGETRDFATVKYDTDGSELWVARYDGPAQDKDEAVAIAVDGGGHVYVTGLSRGVGTLDDFATIKYGPDGLEEWVARYDGPVSNFDWVRGVAVDDSGNVYVTGSTRTDNHFDYVTIRYNPDGEEAWVETHSSSGAQFDEAHAIALDATGNVYVTGRIWGGSYGSGTQHDYFTIKYLPNGQRDWDATYTGPGFDSFDLAYDIAVDALGNVFVTGVSVGMWTGYDFATVKYGPDGDEEWVARYDSRGVGWHVSDVAYAVAVDGEGGAYVTGVTGTGGSSNFTTIGYSALGVEEWVLRYNAPTDSADYAWDMAVSAEQDVYVCGASYDSITSSDCTTVKYTVATGVPHQGGPEPALRLLSPRPNPFGAETHIGYEVPAGIGRARLTVHNARGQLVRVLLDGSAQRGRREFLWDGRDETGAELASGVYFALLEVGETMAVRKMVLLR
ncbi:MAG: SBBP repeat-containing protein [Candidatus Eisenbacteria bacterium]